MLNENLFQALADYSCDACSVFFLCFKVRLFVVKPLAFYNLTCAKKPVNYLDFYTLILQIN